MNEDNSMVNQFKLRPLRFLAIIIISFVTGQIVESAFGQPIQDFCKQYIWTNNFFLNYCLPIIISILVPIVLIVITVYVLFSQDKTQTSESKIQPVLPTNGPQALYIYPRSDSSNFHEAASQLMLQSSKIVLIGTGMNILHHDPLRIEIMERAKNEDCILEIYLADPRSPSIEDRLIEEETGDDKPPVGRNGLISRLKTLINSWEVLGKPKNIKINLFSNYPTFALLIIDSSYFFYPYGFAKLGNYSPVLQFSKKDPLNKDFVNFLDEQYKKIKLSSVDAHAAFSLPQVSGDKDYLNKFEQFALYFIPPEDSPLYEFGHKILGYDVRKNQKSASKWDTMVGDARKFGFHLTLCDALFFQNDFEVKRVMAEIEFLAEQINHFDLKNLHIRSDFPDLNSISIVMEDPSGTLEALHHELVQRVYRRAFGSNYSFGLAKMNRDGNLQRAKLISKRYNAPYILNSFTPHFTLLTNVPVHEKEKIKEELENLFASEVADRNIHVYKLAFMSIDKNNSEWVIRREIELK